MGESGGARLSLQRRVGKSYAIAAAGRCLSGGDEANPSSAKAGHHRFYRTRGNNAAALESPHCGDADAGLIGKLLRGPVEQGSGSPTLLNFHHLIAIISVRSCSPPFVVI